MQVTLFTRTSEKSELQERLDRDASQVQAAAVEDLPLNAPQSCDSEESKPPFNRPHQPLGVFRVDLINGWQKP